jgi:hypothetical protein
MWRRVALVRNDVSEERIVSIVRAKRFSELGKTLSLFTAKVLPTSPIFVTLNLEVIRYSETSVVTAATWRHFQNVGILHIHRRENKPYTHAE